MMKMIMMLMLIIVRLMRMRMRMGAATGMDLMPRGRHRDRPRGQGAGGTPPVYITSPLGGRRGPSSYGVRRTCASGGRASNPGQTSATARHDNHNGRRRRP